MTVPLPLPTTPSPDEQDFPAIQNSAADIAIQFCLQQIGKPYRWGATGPDSYDCSGLMQTAWKKAGVDLPRTALMQSRTGTAVAGIEQAVPGDLVFPYLDESHVAMFIGNGQVIEAPTTGIPVHVVKFYGAKGGIRRITSNPGTPVAGIGGQANASQSAALDKIMTVIKALSKPGDWASIAFVVVGGGLVGVIGYLWIGDKL